MVRWLRLVGLCVVVSLLFAGQALATSPNLVISQVYGGGGNSGATYTHDYIEIFNRGLTLIDTTGMSVQYGSTTGNIGPNTAQITPLSGFLAPGQYLLVQEAQGAGGTTPLSPDITDSTPIAMSATGGKVALVNSTAGLNCGATTTPASPCSAAALAQVVDLVGYDGATMFEGTPTPSLSNTSSALRNNGGCTDSDSNAADFTIGAPNPRNRLTPIFSCVGDTAPFISDRAPADGATGVAVDDNVSITFSEPVNVSGTWFSISCGSSGSHSATASGGPSTFTLNPDADFAPAESCTVTVFGGQVSDQDANDPPDNVDGNPSWSFTTVAPAVRIHEIQGATHTSPRVGQSVSDVVGVVTAKRSNGYYIQDPNPDADPATSDGLFVFTSSSPTSVNVGDSVRVSGNVAEFRAGGASSTNLTTTEITSPTTVVVSTGNPLPPTSVIGAGGRVPPSETIEDDASGSVETSGVFDPSQDGIDFYESLEGMRLQVNNPVVVGPRSSFGEIFVLADDGAGAAARTARGGIVIRDLGPEPPGDYRSGDFNPERIQLDDAAGVPTPAANVGDHFTGPAVGILDYDFANFELNLTGPLTTVADGVTRETTASPGTRELSVATFNVENLDAAEPQSKFDALAQEIVENLRSPDVIALEEIQDNNGATNDSVVAADQTLNKLAAAVAAAGGPTYDWRQINPVDDQDGGEPGGNIRVGFFFRADRGLAFVDRPGGGSTTPTTVVSGPNGPQLSASPGRVEPTNTAWNASRKPLAGEFTYRGETFFLVANHFNSKGGDQPLFGRFQPPTRITEVQRHQQAQLVNNFVDSIFAVDAGANVVVLGDINDFEFSQTMSILEGGVLHDLMNTLPQDERYSYVFEGNSQTLDHIVVSGALFGGVFTFDPVHVNAEFADQLSDHDPSVARFLVDAAPSVDAGGPYTVAEGGSVTLTATGADPNGDALSYAWDLDSDGEFDDASGSSVSFSAGDGPASQTVSVQVDDGAQTAADSATASITNEAPSAVFSAPATVYAGFPFVLSLGSPQDPSAADTAAGFTYAFDCGDGAGFGSFGTSPSRSCPTDDIGTRSVGGRIRDKDNGVREYHAVVRVEVTFDSLCDLTKAYSSKSQTAETLCGTLRSAARARNAAARNRLLSAYQNQVDAQTGKAFTPTQAATLKRLADRLKA